MQPKHASFHAHHSPMGALASFTCGAHNSKAGMGIELDSAYPGELTVGFFDADKTLHRLPLFEGSDNSEAERYIEGKEGVLGKQKVMSDISREYLWATDCIESPNVCFEIITPFFNIPEPGTASAEALAFACCPAVHVRITFKNTYSQTIKGVFALGINHRWSSLAQQDHKELTGATSQNSIGFATLSKQAKCFIDFDPVSALNRQHTTPEFLLGLCAGLEIDVEPNGEKTLDIVLGFYKEGAATYNRDTQYFYTQYFHSLVDVLNFGLNKREQYLEQANARNQELAQSVLSDDQKFMIAHATRSYYGSTQWLWDGNKSLWVVNEGEYMMMNTFDLAVDMLFFELHFNPWTVRNELEQFVDNYSFYDQVFDPDTPDTLYPGGISFTHDMGVMNHWSPQGTSSYELSGLDRACFSHMTCEQLTNWVLCAGVYYHQTNDTDFLDTYIKTFKACLSSLQNRDNPTAKLRNGIMGFESERTKGGGEITTYDSLDHSLGQARNNIYLGGKMWASYVLLESVFKQSNMPELAQEAQWSAVLAATTISNAYNEELGYIPAILDGKSISAIIPAIEALAYPYAAGLAESVSEQGPYKVYIAALKKHFSNIMKRGLCLYENGAWKLSSTADNSWPSKIVISQFVAKEVLGFDLEKISPTANKAMVEWQQKGATIHACSDQFKSGVAIGSLYYPRVVTNILWLNGLNDGTTVRKNSTTATIL